MDINHTRKVINSILQDKVTAEDCRKALSELDALAQAQSDLGRVVAGLEKTRDGLKAEVLTLNGKVEAAQVKAADILAKAEADAKGAIAAAADNIEAMQSKADRKLRETNDLVASMQGEALKAKQLQDENAAVKKALDEEKARLEKVKADLLSIMNVKG